MGARKNFCINPPRSNGLKCSSGTYDLHIKNIAHALFDPGATHSIISSAFTYKLNQVSEPLGFQLVVSTPLGVKIIANTKYVNCEVMIGEMKTSIDLIKLGEMEFDAI